MAELRERLSTATAFLRRKRNLGAVRRPSQIGGNRLGTVHDISFEERWVDVKKRGDSVDIHPDAVFAHNVVDADVLADVLARIGLYVVEHGMQGDGSYLAAPRPAHATAAADWRTADPDGRRNHT